MPETKLVGQNYSTPDLRASSTSLPTTLPDSVESYAVIAAMGSDKKARGGKTRFALPSRVGSMAGEESGWTIAVSNDQLREVLA